MGLRQDISLTGDNYQWLASLFYFGYLAWEWPTVRLLQRLPIAKYSGFCIIAWGITLALFAVVKNFAGAAVIRVLLGAFEAAVTPGWALITSQWYRKSEQGSRTCFCKSRLLMILDGASVSAQRIFHPPLIPLAAYPR